MLFSFAILELVKTQLALFLMDALYLIRYHFLFWCIIIIISLQCWYIYAAKTVL